MNDVIFLRFKLILPLEDLRFIYYSRLKRDSSVCSSKCDSGKISYVEEERLFLSPHQGAISISQTNWANECLGITKIIKSPSSYFDGVLREYGETSDQLYFFESDLGDVSSDYCSDAISYECRRISEKSYKAILARLWPQSRSF